MQNMSQQRLKLAAIISVYTKYSDAQQILDRLLDGYGWEGVYHHPPMDIVSLYVERVGADDLSRERASRHPEMKIYSTIAGALTQGGGTLAVDGVVLITEHGKYADAENEHADDSNFKAFQEIVDVFRSSNRITAVFSDKQLSSKWDRAKEMYETSHSMGFPLMAGSSLPITWRIPSVEMPLGCSIRASVCVCYDGIGLSNFDGLEAIQCMMERRSGGEVGVRWLRTYRGDRFWHALETGVWPRGLMDAALCRSDTLQPAKPSFNDIFPTVGQMHRLVKDPVAYVYQHCDGARCALLMMNGLVRDFNFAAEISSDPGIFSTQMYLPMPDGRTTLADYFSPLVFNIERMFLTGKPQYPVERTLLTTGLRAAGSESLSQNQARLETPHLAIRYEPRRASTFERS